LLAPANFLTWLSEIVRNREADPIAGSRAIKEALHLRKLWHDLFDAWVIIPIRMDNQSALVLIQNPAAGFETRGKYFAVCCNFPSPCDLW
jgi:hypothetical protein